MITIFKKEISSFFSSLIAYVVMTVFLTALGLIVWVFPQTNVIEYGYADLTVYFSLVPYVLIFLAPAITMRSYTEEVRNGTLELLLTKPLTSIGLVLGKFLANWLLILLTLMPTVLYYISLYLLGNPEGNIDSAAVLSSYIGLGLLSGALVALGSWVSALSTNQVVAFVVAVFLGFIWYVGFSSIAELIGVGQFAKILSQIALDEQYHALGLGLMDTRNILFLLSAMVLFLALTEQKIYKISH